MSHRRRRPPPHPRPSPATRHSLTAVTNPGHGGNIEGIADAVANGEFDRHIEALAEAVSRRVVLLRGAAREAILMATLRKGDRARINHSARPPVPPRRIGHRHRLGGGTTSLCASISLWDASSTVRSVVHQGFWSHWGRDLNSYSCGPFLRR